MGLLNPLYDAVSWIILQFHALFSPIFGKGSGWSWGLAIACLVVVIRICLIPLFVKQIRATRNMQILQPKIKEIQKRYKDDRERQSQEMMKLYKETGTNPLSSCLPILVQMPFFFALFHVLNRVSQGKTVGVLSQSDVNSAKEAHIFGAPIAAKFLDSASEVAKLGADLSTVRIVTVVMIVMMSASQFITQRQLMVKNTDPTAMAANPFAQQQKILMYVFPIMFAVFGINFPVGVLLYWLTTNLWTMGQQMYVIQRNPTPGSIAFQARQERLAEKARKQGKVLTPEGDVVDAEEYERKQAEEKERAAKRTQPSRTSKAKRKSGGPHGPAPQRSTVKGSTARTPPSGKNGTPPADSDAAESADTGGSANGRSGQARQNGQNGQNGQSRPAARKQTQSRKQAQSRKGRKKS
ncbi:membrane protein insertase YidC [Yinghuangia sp. ASG 101]|uniref:membrane protein insertase YidC n=1 Tax=Yinghuangia sp. ASG 101 TaxID=2896848 RepID=UPI001E578AF9|nr:membrane protein insertase YidC [Yinghuangia sp. ASG 101]UGQ08872.1 membrane protein insertase YidC [Yinghuangia sp. ASG 101]